MPGKVFVRRWSGARGLVQRCAVGPRRPGRGGGEPAAHRTLDLSHAVKRELATGIQGRRAIGTVAREVFDQGAGTGDHDNGQPDRFYESAHPAYLTSDSELGASGCCAGHRDIPISGGMICPPDEATASTAPCSRVASPMPRCLRRA